MMSMTATGRAKAASASSRMPMYGVAGSEADPSMRWTTVTASSPIPATGASRRYRTQCALRLVVEPTAGGSQLDTMRRALEQFDAD
jgi:hypothetical protein